MNKPNFFHCNVFFFLGILLVLFSYAAPAQAIYNGSYENIPQVGLIALGNPDRPARTCSGTLIAPRLVLSSAECFDGISHGMRIGFWIQPIPLQATVEYPALDFQILDAGGDIKIAVVLLALSVSPNYAVPLNVKSDNVLWQEDMFLDGWGWSCADPVCNQSDQRLHDWYVHPTTPQPSFICPGDTGGPAFSHDFDIIGVLKSGTCGLQGYDRIISTAFFYDELRKLIAQYGGPSYCTTSISPLVGSESTRFVSTLNAYGATTCTYILDGAPAQSCNLSSPPTFTGLKPGTHSLSFTVSSAQGTSPPCVTPEFKVGQYAAAINGPQSAKVGETKLYKLALAGNYKVEWDLNLQTLLHQNTNLFVNIPKPHHQLVSILLSLFPLFAK